MITRLLTGISLIAIGVFGFAFTTQAAPIYGSQSPVENGCLSPIPFFVGQDCSYDGSNPDLFYSPLLWIGPMAGENYYLPGESALGEGTQKRLGISGDLVVDGAGVISGTIDIAAGERVSACSQSDVCTESWDSISHAVPATAANPALTAPNSAGGSDYEYSSKGMPVPLEPCVPYFFPLGGGLCDWDHFRDGFNFAAQLFPSVTPSIPFAGGAWKSNYLTDFTGHSNGPLTATPGLTTLEGGFSPFQRNDGIQTVATMVNYSCAPNSGNPADCNGNVTFGADQIPNPPGPPPGPGFTEGNPSYENLHLKISTNASGTIIACEAAWTQEYSLLSFVPTQPDSWGGGTLNCSGIRAGTAAGAQYKDVQINKKNIMPVVIYGAVGFDVSTIDGGSLQFGPGEYTLAPTTGGIAHNDVHIADVDSDGIDDLTAHFHSNESDLRCGQALVPLRGTTDGVPFVVDIGVNGIGKACR